MQESNCVIVTTLKITSDSDVVIRELLEFLGSRYRVIPTSRILKGDHDNFFAYAQIFEGAKP